MPGRNRQNDNAKKANSLYIKSVLTLHALSLAVSIYITQYASHNIIDVKQRIPDGFDISKRFLDVLDFITRQNFTNLAFLVGLQLTTNSKAHRDD